MENGTQVRIIKFYSRKQLKVILSTLISRSVLLLLFVAQSALAANFLTCEFSAVPYTCTVRNAQVAEGVGIDGFGGEHLPGMFNSNVERVVFQNSRMHAFPHEIFSHFGNVKEVRVSRNEIQVVSAFESCSNLENLDISWNRIQSLAGNVFDACSNLKQISMGYNQYGNLDRNIFAKLPNLEALGMQNSGLTRFDFEGLHQLHSIALQGNFINVLTADMFRNLENLDTLLLTQNGITYIDKEILAPLKNLKTLLLSQNTFQVMYGDTFHNNPQLSLLSLNFCQINAMERNFFDGLPNLRYLEMQSNRCVTRKFFPAQEGVDRVKSLLEPCFQNFDNLN